MSSPFTRLRADRRGVFAKELTDLDPAGDPLLTARSLGLSGCFVGAPTTISADLDSGVLRDYAAKAADLGIKLNTSLGSLNPIRPERSTEALQAGNGNLFEGFVKLLIGCAELGATGPMVVVGIEADRFDRVIPWAEHLAAVRSFLQSVRPYLLEFGMRVLVKTHQELTSWEALDLIDATGSDAFSVAFDPVNLIVRMEDPVAAAARLAGSIAQVHVDDARLVADNSGLHRALCPVGDGDIDWQALTNDVLRSDPDAWWWAEIHRAELDMPFLANEWFDHHPDITLTEVARWLERGVRARRDTRPLYGDVPARIARAVEKLGTHPSNR